MDIVADDMAAFLLFFFLVFLLGNTDEHANAQCYENTLKNNDKLGEILGKHEKLCMITGKFWKI